MCRACVKSALKLDGRIIRRGISAIRIGETDRMSAGAASAIISQIKFDSPIDARRNGDCTNHSASGRIQADLAWLKINTIFGLSRVDIGFKAQSSDTNLTVAQRRIGAWNEPIHDIECRIRRKLNADFWITDRGAATPGLRQQSHRQKGDHAEIYRCRTDLHFLLLLVNGKSANSR